jgi:polyhydroxybutyrate depolymerase
LVHVPDREATMIMLSLHGTRSRAERQAQLSRLSALSDRSGVVVVFPEAEVPIGGGFEWEPDSDTDFLELLVAAILERYPVPGGRAVITGMSGGARMACHFADLHPELTSMVGAVAGLRAPNAPTRSRPVPILAFHGTADRINPYTGSGTARWHESVEAAARAWALANGEEDARSETAVSSSLTRTTFGKQGKPGEVTLWTARKAGHTWPGSKLGLVGTMFLGRTNLEIDATNLIWEFATQHALEP